VKHAAPKRRVGSVVSRRFLHKNLVSKPDLLVQASQYPKFSGFLHESIGISTSIVGLLIGCKALRNWSGFKPQKSKQIDLYLMHIPTSLKAWHYIPFRRVIDCTRRDGGEHDWKRGETSIAKTWISPLCHYFAAFLRAEFDKQPCRD
jgi:hypothetical protein